MNEHVVDLQNLLNAHHASPHLQITGMFDIETERAVRGFQSMHNIAIDGVVGPQTWVALAQLPCKVCSQHNPFPKASVVKLKAGTQIRKGPGADYSVLKTLPYKTEITVVDQLRTWYKIESPITGYIFGEHIDVAGFIPSGNYGGRPNLELGTSGDYVHELQERLADKLHKNIIPTGVFDNTTRSDVISFQVANRLPATGIVDFKLWELLLI